MGHRFALQSTVQEHLAPHGTLDYRLRSETLGLGASRYKAPFIDPADQSPPWSKTSNRRAAVVSCARALVSSVQNHAIGKKRF